MVDPGTGSVSYLSAGHGPILQYIRATDRFVERPADALPMGIQAGAVYDEPIRLDMSTGDLLILITDGFFEWSNRDGEAFGIARIREHLRTRRDRPCSEMIETLYGEVLAFAPGTVQADDMTAIVVKKL